MNSRGQPSTVSKSYGGFTTGLQHEEQPALASRRSDIYVYFGPGLFGEEDRIILPGPKDWCKALWARKLHRPPPLLKKPSEHLRSKERAADLKSRGICRVLVNGKCHAELKVAEALDAKSREICRAPA